MNAISLAASTSNGWTKTGRYAPPRTRRPATRQTTFAIASESERTPIVEARPTTLLTAATMASLIGLLAS